jgi:hypothetical protein
VKQPPFVPHSRAKVSARWRSRVEPRGDTFSWLPLRRWAPESAISGAPEPEPSVKRPFGRAPTGAAAGAGAGALPKRPSLFSSTVWLLFLAFYLS